MKRKNGAQKNVPPARLYKVICKSILHYHLQPENVLTRFWQDDNHFTSDEEVIDEFRHLFDEAGDPYSCILKTNEAGADIDPENDDKSPDVTFEKVRPDIGLIKLSKFRHKTCAKNFAAALKALSVCSSLILDLRDNPGGLHLQALDIAQLLMDEGNLGSQAMKKMGRLTAIDYTLTSSQAVTTVSNWDGSEKESTSTKRRTNLAGNKPVVVLVNENTKSAAEVLASILQENNRAKLIGQRTFGKGRGTSNLKIPNGLELQVLGFYWFTPTGRCIGTSPDDPDKGIAPDFEIADNDHWINRAIELL